MIVQDEGVMMLARVAGRCAGRLDVEGGTRMSMHRLYTGDDGESHMEELDLAGELAMKVATTRTALQPKPVPSKAAAPTP